MSFNSNTVTWYVTSRRVLKTRTPPIGRVVLATVLSDPACTARPQCNKRSDPQHESGLLPYAASQLNIAIHLILPLTPSLYDPKTADFSFKFKRREIS